MLFKFGVSANHSPVFGAPEAVSDCAVPLTYNAHAVPSLTIATDCHALAVNDVSPVASSLVSFSLCCIPSFAPEER